jgi:hypothetical protein
MPSNRKLYWILSLIVVGSYGWIGYHLSHSYDHSTGETLCLFKNITELPCPSCGVTRSVLALLNGNIQQALYINPIGVLGAVLLVIIPGWMTFDLVRKQTSLVSFYIKCETILRHQRVYIPLIALVLLNWIWNVTKGL